MLKAKPMEFDEIGRDVLALKINQTLAFKIQGPFVTGD